MQSVAQAPTKEGVYRVFQRFTNSTFTLVEDFEISLVFGLGDGFVNSVKARSINLRRGK